MEFLTEEQFYENYTVCENHISGEESFGGMYETYGEEDKYIRNLSRTSKRVWTIVEGDNGKLFFSSGYHFVNRIGYIVTEEEYSLETEVELEMF